MFDKWEMRTVSPEEWAEISASGEGKFIRRNADGSYVIRQKVSKEIIKKQEVPIERAPKRVFYEIFRERDVIGGSLRTVVLKRGTFKTKTLFGYHHFLDWQGRRFFPNHILKETYREGKKDKVRHIIRWNVNYSEAMSADGRIEYSSELENLDMNDMVLQLKRAVGVIQGIVLDRNMQVIMLMAMVFGIPIGLSYNDLFHWVPNTVVHWVQR